MQAINYIDLDPSDQNVRNTSNYWMCLIESKWCEYKLEVYKSKKKNGNKHVYEDIKRMERKIQDLMERIQTYKSLITDDMVEELHSIFLQFDGGGDHEIEDNGDADSMRENLWRDALRKGRLSKEDKKLMTYRPWEAIRIPPDYLTRFYHHLLHLVEWDFDERDGEAYRAMNFR